jgi:tetratricopeptide (TPR) repeat protein
LAGQAQQKLGAYAKALGVYDRAVAHFGVNTGLFNAIGECLVRLDRPKEALAAWEKSLAIDANQPEIRKKAEGLKDKK